MPLYFCIRNRKYPNYPIRTLLRFFRLRAVLLTQNAKCPPIAIQTKYKDVLTLDIVKQFNTLSPRVLRRGARHAQRTVF